MAKEKTYILKKDCPNIGKEVGDYYNNEYSNSIEDLIADGTIEEEKRSRCCGALLIEGVQCEACGADDRMFVQMCPSCHTYKEDPLDIEQIEETGECLACDKLRGEFSGDNL